MSVPGIGHEAVKHGTNNHNDAGKGIEHRSNESENPSCACATEY